MGKLYFEDYTTNNQRDEDVIVYTTRALVGRKPNT